MEVFNGIREFVQVPIGRQLQYLVSYNENIQILEIRLRALERRREKLEMLVGEAENNLQIISEEVLYWLRCVEEIERESEEILGDDVPGRTGVNCLKCKCPNLKIRYLLSRKASLTIQKIERLCEEPEPKFRSTAAPPPPLFPVSNRRKLSLPSRSSVEQEIMDALNSDVVNLIGICGIGGIGKTEMAKEVVRRARDEMLFDEIVMVVVSQVPDLTDIQDDIAEMLGLKMVMVSIQARARHLRERLTCDRRTLVILDDVWEPIDLENLGIPVGDMNCKVVLTSRFEKVCRDVGTQKNFTIHFLSEEEAWDLFKSRVGECVENDDLHDIAKAIVLACGGLPLEIISTATELIGGSKRDWEAALTRLTHSTSTVPRERNKFVLDDALHKLRKHTVGAYSTVKLSYDGITRTEAKSLFLLCCQFPEAEFISIEMLVRYARGLQGFEEFETLGRTRNNVCSLVDELKGRGLLVEDGESLVKVEDIPRHVGKSIASKDGNKMCVVGNGLKECRHNDKYEPYTTISVHSNEMHELPTNLHLANVNLLWLAYSHLEQMEISADFFQGMEDLKVIHVRANIFKPLPLSPKFLKNLQTLCLDHCSLLVDISFIGDLKTLEILTFFNSRLEVLPSQIRELSKLKLLDLRCSTGPRMIPSGVLSSLERLEELYTGRYFDVANDEIHENRNSADVKELNLLSQLRVLQISVELDNLILRKLKKFRFENLIGFDFSMSERKSLPFPKHQSSNMVALYRVDMSAVLRTNIKALMRRAEKLSLRGLMKLENHAIELDREVFANLKRLCLSNCRGVERVLDPVEDSAIANLESLEIVDMPDLTEISCQNLLVGSFGRLQELYLNGLPAMKYLWRGRIERPSLGNLRILMMCDCNAIESLFPLSVAKCLLQLQEVKVTKCHMLTEAVSRGRDEDLEVIEFPKLKELALSTLPTFRRLYPEPTHYGDPVQSLFNRQVILPNMEILDVSDLSNRVTIVADGHATFLHKLRVLRVSKCMSLEAVFDLKRYKNGGELAEVMLGQLESVELRELPNLTHIWRTFPQGCQGLLNLRSLEVTSCDRMRYLLSPSMAGTFVNLQELKLAGCEMMKQVIEVEAEGSSKVEMMDKMVIPQLRTLHLKDLEDLKIFWNGNRDLELPLLENVFISNCPNMMTFYSGRIIAPNLLRVETQHRNLNEWVWKGDLNSTVMYISK